MKRQIEETLDLFAGIVAGGGKGSPSKTWPSGPAAQAEARFHWCFCQREMEVWAAFPGSVL